MWSLSVSPGRSQAEASEVVSGVLEHVVREVVGRVGFHEASKSKVQEANRVGVHEAGKSKVQEPGRVVVQENGKSEV